MFRKRVGSIRKHSLKYIWHENPPPILKEFRRLRPEEIEKCFTCEMKKYCSRCPGVAYNETHEIRKPSPSACIYAKNIVSAFNNY
jgi:radical SAM protein with 4Fe4S-binding SPASM domain